ncbi:hypothetical protein DX933_00850 [Ornithinibacillus gellani]|uniref:hypothetical protein n=1 Tax=Ornithinibacillus gellani TaxID=2293253 RepID=UPI000F49AA0C|nr:hypothetical protein [Ornithinibacillus gellani]TQS76425.1 hypothetical protein DX933_00850 [Ornithinibacillus gellani]
MRTKRYPYQGYGNQYQARNTNIQHWQPYEFDEPIQQPTYNQHTPFSYYAKPQQPANWHENVHSQGNYPIQGSSSQQLDWTYHQGSHPPYLEENELQHGLPPYMGNDMQQPQFTENGYMQSSQQSQPIQQQSSPPSSNAPSPFQNTNGQIDFDKMLSTVGQIANTYHQVAPIVKQFGALMKSIRS